MIEERNPELQRISHGDLICLDQQIIRQPGLGIDIKQLIQKVGIFYPQKKRIGQIVRPSRIQTVPEVGCVETILVGVEITEWSRDATVIILAWGWINQGCVLLRSPKLRYSRETACQGRNQRFERSGCSLDSFQQEQIS